MGVFFIISLIKNCFWILITVVYLTLEKRVCPALQEHRVIMVNNKFIFLK